MPVVGEPPCAPLVGRGRLDFLQHVDPRNRLSQGPKRNLNRGLICSGWVLRELGMDCQLLTRICQSLRDSDPMSGEHVLTVFSHSRLEFEALQPHLMEYFVMH